MTDGLNVPFVCEDRAVTAHLYLVRHGETDWNRQRRIQGATDVPLNNLGREQAARAADLLSRRHIDAVVASPLSRAAETGAIIANRLGLPSPGQHQGLTERAYGDAEGLTNEELAERFPDGVVRGRESRSVLLRRAIAALDDIASTHVDQSVVVATHGAVIRAVVSTAAPDVADLAIPIRNGSIHSFRWEPESLRAHLVRFDDPIEEASEAVGVHSFEYQNPLERPRR